MAYKQTREQFIQKANIVHKNKYDYSKVEYKNNSTKVCVICPVHGEFWQSPNKHLQGRGCPKCAQIKRNIKKAFTQEEFVNKANNVHNFKYRYNDDYKNVSTKIRIICPIHGEFWQLPSHHLAGQGCPKCAVEKTHNLQKLTIEEFIQKANIIHNNKYNYKNTIYNSYKENLKIICPEHGEFWQTPDVHLHGHGCPKCGKQTSKGEDEIVHFLEKECGLKVEIRDKTIIKPCEIDIYIPSKKVAIEYNGLIWHSEKFGKDRTYHLNKTELCEKQGIRLIHIFEDEWLEHEKIVKSKLMHILGLNNKEKIFARKCIIKEITKNESDLFLDKNHIQGACNSSVYLGCYYGQELVGVMLFKKEKEDYNLVRFASDIDKHCIGIASKLFTYFINKYHFKQIKTFADRRWSTTLNTTLYDKLGFKLDKIIKPDYSYIDNNGKRLHKFLCRKKRLLTKYKNMNLNANMTENEMTEKVNLFKIWNCGLFRYVFYGN